MKRVWWLGLAVAGTLLIEIVIHKYATYQYPDLVLNLLPIMVFAALTVGNLLGMSSRLAKWNERAWLLASAATSLFALVGLGRLPDLGLLWIGLPFLAYGALLTRVMATIELRDIVIGFALGGVFLYLILGVTFQSLAPWLGLICVILPLLAAVIGPMRTRRHLFEVLVLTAAVVTQFVGGLEPQFLLKQLHPQIQEATVAMPPLYTPLIRTDLLEAKTGQSLIITNGRRFASISPREKHDAYMSDPKKFIPSYDTPYLFQKPKSVLVIGSAEGANIRAALRAGAEKITAVDINPSVFQIMKGILNEKSGGVYTDPRVHTVAMEGRHFLETTKEKFDLITLQGVQTGSHDSPLNLVMIESYLLTKESLRTLWSRLTPDGMLWIEEYRTSLGGNSETLVQYLGRTARQTLPITDFQSHYGLFTYMQSQENPRGESRNLREGLLLSPSPLGANQTEIQSRGALKGLRALPLPESAKFDQGVLKTDNRPFFIPEFHILRVAIWLFAIVILLTVGGALLVSALRPLAFEQSLGLAQFFIGVGFILMVMAALGPLGLYLGDPQLATPLLFICTYGFGLMGGLLALRVGEPWLKRSLLMLAFYAFVLQFTLDGLKEDLIAMSSISARVLILTILLAPLALVIELPYVWILKAFEGRARARSYMLENLGSLVGVLIGFWAQYHFGFSGTMFAMGFSFFLAYLLLSEHNRPVFKFLKLGLVAVTCIGVVFVTWRPASQLIRVGGVSTLDCETEPPATEVEVNFANADALQTGQQVDVITGVGDGCYVHGAVLNLSAIRRDPITREVVRREPRFVVRLEQLLRVGFEELSDERRKFVTEKFGEKATQMDFDLLWLRRP